MSFEAQKILNHKPQQGLSYVYPMFTSPVFALIRHGDYHQPLGVPSALLPYQLTEEGFQQARAAGSVCEQFATINDLKLHPVLDSSLQLRAWQTAQLIAETLAGDFQVHEHVCISERSMGAAANLTVQQIETILNNDPRYEVPLGSWKSDSHYCLPFQGAESLMQAGERVAQHIKDQSTEVAPSTLKIIVGHGAAIRHACVHLGILDLTMVSTISMHHARPVFISCFEDGWRMVGGEWKQRARSGEGDEIRE